MSGRIFISHSAADAQLGEQIVEFLAATIRDADVAASSLPGRVPLGGDDSLTALKQRLASAEVVIGLITPQALASGEVPFQLGAAWALGTRVVLLLARERTAGELYLPMGHGEALVLGPEALLELAASLANAAGLRAEVGGAARAALLRLFPDFQGLDRESSERLTPAAATSSSSSSSSSSTQQLWPVNEDGTQPDRPAKASSVRPGLPSCAAALQAGRTLADCVLHRAEGGAFADELDAPFGAFLAALGADWSALRKLDDLDVWTSAAENVLSGLAPAEQHVRAFYEVGYQLATLINLAHGALESAVPDAELEQKARQAFGALRVAALAAGVTPGDLDDLQPLVENLYAGAGERDFANLGTVQERVRDLASRADAAVLAASA